MIYLASPYTHDDPAVRRHRAWLAAVHTGDMIARGFRVISPVVHSHEVHAATTTAQGGHVLGLDWATWQDWCLELLSMCSEVWVLMLDGWEDSVGVTQEVARAQELGLPVRYCGFLEVPRNRADE